MSYQGPINIIYGGFRTIVESDILTAVQSVGVNVDKDELLKALQYDRGQYQKGYADRDSEIVRCKECWKRNLDNCPFYDITDTIAPDEWFCPAGEKKEILGEEKTNDI